MSNRLHDLLAAAPVAACVLLAASGAASGAAPAVVAQTSPPGRATPDSLASDEQRAVRALAPALDARWNARDADGLAGLFTPDADVEIRSGSVQRMRGPAVRDRYRAMLAQAPAALRHRSAVDELHLVAPGVVMADGRAWIERANPDSSRAPLRAYTTKTLLVRGPGGWRVRVARSHAEPLDSAAWRTAVGAS